MKSEYDKLLDKEKSAEYLRQWHIKNPKGEKVGILLITLALMILAAAAFFYFLPGMAP